MSNGLGKAAAVTLTLVLLAAAAAGAQDGDIPQDLAVFARDTLLTLAQDTRLAELVAKENLMPIPLDKLREMDRRWREDDGIDDFRAGLLYSLCSTRLQDLVNDFGFIVEAYVTNAQGTVVGATRRTASYWKGGDRLFTGPYKGGEGTVVIGEARAGTPDGTVLLPIAVPVVQLGRPIGSLGLEVSLTAWGKR